jgi:3-oxoacyl-[acyl-carrier-protein] synthase II
MGAREAPGVWVTGIGLVSCLGLGEAAHWEALRAPGGVADRSRRLAGMRVTPAAPLDLDRYVPNRIEQKRLGAVQAIAVQAAGDALDCAGLLGNRRVLSDAVVVVGAIGGERDPVFDQSILSDPARYADPAELNQRMVMGVRPSLFLAQLPNLVAGCLSIAFGVAGGSRTILGEETGGANALCAAHQLIRAGRAEVVLVGSAFTAQREDLLLLYGAGGVLWRGEGPPPPVGARGTLGGAVLGSVGGFLVLEAAAHAAARGATPYGRLATAAAHQVERTPGVVARLVQEALPTDVFGLAVLSGASGAAPATAEELGALVRRRPAAVRATGSVFGHGFEAVLPFNAALAASALRRGALWPAQPGDPPDGAVARPERILVTAIGAVRGEGFALLERCGGADG